MRWWTLVSLVRWMDWQCTNSKKSVPWELTGCTVLHVIIVLQNLRHSLSFSCSTLKFQIMTWSAAVTFFMYFSNSLKFVPIIFFTSFVFATQSPKRSEAIYSLEKDVFRLVTKKKFWVSMRNRTSDLHIPRFDKKKKKNCHLSYSIYLLLVWKLKLKKKTQETRV